MLPIHPRAMKIGLQEIKNIPVKQAATRPRDSASSTTVDDQKSLYSITGKKDTRWDEMAWDKIIWNNMNEV